MNTISNIAKILLAVIASMAATCLAGCYLWQSAQGEFAVLARRRPIERVVDDTATAPALRTQLEEAASIRAFASAELGLPDNGSYRSYTDIGRRYVVWNVVVAPEFSVEPRKWCYPLVGCVAYRGYFSEEQARAFARRWQTRRFDVSVGGVAAFSTLGHFDDPVLSSMLGSGDVELAALVFHELTHQLLYVPGDAEFSEALATVVEEEGVRRWLLSQRRVADLSKHRVGRARVLQTIDLLRSARERLDTLYTSGLEAPAMRNAKLQQVTELSRAYARLTAEWGARPPFAEWFERGVNNAELASVATYYDCVPGFERELAAVDGDLRRFYTRVFELANMDAAVRDAAVCARASG